VIEFGKQIGEFGASAHDTGERFMHRISTQAKARLRSSDFRLQCPLNFSCVLKVGARFVDRSLGFGNCQPVTIAGRNVMANISDTLS
jgi:hypothetical protein